MQCGLESLNDCERSPNRTNLRVNFTEKGEAVKERREKFLTAKYGSHQMSLIRKRLAVEMWLYDELQKLFDPPVSLFISSSRLWVWVLALDFNYCGVVVIFGFFYRVISCIFSFSFFFRFHHHRKTEAIDVDIDEILDMDTDDIRVSHLTVSFSFHAPCISHTISNAEAMPQLMRQFVVLSIGTNRAENKQKLHVKKLYVLTVFPLSFLFSFFPLFLLLHRDYFATVTGLSKTYR